MMLKHPGFCTPCAKDGRSERLYNHVTGEPCSPEEVLVKPIVVKNRVKTVMYNVELVF